ncbi:hypothetical protein B7H19_09175 [Pseudomonas putida]|nr:hypothetical protein B7H19_09175 [Pseudomonas putida]
MAGPLLKGYAPLQSYEVSTPICQGLAQRSIANCLQLWRVSGPGAGQRQRNIGRIHHPIQLSIALYQLSLALDYHTGAIGEVYGLVPLIDQVVRDLLHDADPRLQRDAKTVQVLAERAGQKQVNNSSVVIEIAWVARSIGSNRVVSVVAHIFSGHEKARTVAGMLDKGSGQAGGNRSS